MSQLQAAHITRKLPPLRLQHKDELTERLEALLLRCIAWSAEDRMQTVRELREALIALHASAAWTPADAEAFWRSVEKTRFN